MKDRMYAYVKQLQRVICDELSVLDGNRFLFDEWQRSRGGGGVTAVLKGTSVFEKAGVNHSCVYGELTEQEQVLFTRMMQDKGLSFMGIESASSFATGISVVIHPYNPYVPIVHANYRYFELKSDRDFVSWFGGGADLTPSYYFEEDEAFFHQHYQMLCDVFDPLCYDTFKQHCDDYFYLPHRDEWRGVGGIFFDYLREPDQESIFDFVSSCGDSFCDSYLPIVRKRYHRSFESHHKQWQKMRRGRYAEFNLLYDKGTVFGLKTNGRTESILMSLPPEVSWDYCPKVSVSSDEESLINRLRKHI